MFNFFWMYTAHTLKVLTQYSKTYDNGILNLNIIIHLFSVLYVSFQGFFYYLVLCSYFVWFNNFSKCWHSSEMSFVRADSISTCPIYARAGITILTHQKLHNEVVSNRHLVAAIKNHTSEWRTCWKSVSAKLKLVEVPRVEYFIN